MNIKLCRYSSTKFNVLYLPVQNPFQLSYTKCFCHRRYTFKHIVFHVAVRAFFKRQVPSIVFKLQMFERLITVAMIWYAHQLIKFLIRTFNNFYTDATITGCWMPILVSADNVFTFLRLVFCSSFKTYHYPSHLPCFVRSFVYNL